MHTAFILCLLLHDMCQNQFHSPSLFQHSPPTKMTMKKIGKMKKTKTKNDIFVEEIQREIWCVCVFMPLNWVEWIERKIIISKAKQQWWWKTIESKASDYWLKWETNKQTMNVTEFVWSRIPISILLLMAVNSASAAAAVFDTYVNQTLNSHTISFSVQILEPVLLDYYYENTSHP